MEVNEQQSTPTDGVWAERIPASLEEPTTDELERWRELHPCDLKLFGATVMFDGTRRGKIELTLYIDGRDKEFPFPYENMIYDGDSEDMRYSREYIDESFTQTEIDAVKEFLERPDMPFSEFHSYEIDLPITRPWMPQGAIGGGGGEEDYALYEFDGYSLPFRLVGHSYDPRITNLIAQAVGLGDPAPDENRTPEQ